MNIYTPKRKQYRPPLLIKPVSILYSTLVSAAGIALICVILWPQGNYAHAEPQTTVQAQIEAPDPVVEPAVVNPDVEKAEKWLVGTPMAGLGQAIIDTATARGVDWKLVIGIAEAESNRGVSYVHSYDKANCHNAWGIKPPKSRRSDGSYLRCYYTWQDGINTIVGIISRRYAGKTPEQMNCVYVQPCNKNWVATINLFVKN